MAEKVVYLSPIRHLESYTMQIIKIALILKTDKLKHINENVRDKTKCPIYLRIYVDGKRTIKSTGHSIEKKHWDKDKELIKSTNRIASHINADLTTKKNELYKTLISDQVSGKVVSVGTIKKSMRPGDAANFFQYVEGWVPTVRNKRSEGTLKNYTKHLKKLEEFVGSKNLAINDITPDFLSRYENHLRETVGNNYTHGLIKTLRTFINAAKKEKLVAEYPFEAYEFPRYNSPAKDYLTAEQLKKWETLIPELKGSVLYNAATWFFFACYCGLRISDWYQFDRKHVEGDFIRLDATTKTKTPVVMPISKPLRRAIDLVLETELTDREQKINEKLKVIGEKLKIKKHITTHTGRHTFAVTICLGNKVTSETAARLMSITLETFVNNYSQVTDEKIKRETAEAWGNLT